MKYLSLFTGIGGFEVGIQNAYEINRNTHVQTIRGRKKDTEGEPKENRKGLHAISSKTAIHSHDRNHEWKNYYLELSPYYFTFIRASYTIYVELCNSIYKLTDNI